MEDGKMNKPKLTADDWRNDFYPALDQWEEDWVKGKFVSEKDNNNIMECQIERLQELGLIK
jgi:hypothetical protein